MPGEKNGLPVPAGDYYEIITKVATVKDVDIQKLKELMEIRENYLNRRAEEHWNNQMAVAQGKMGPISKDMSNPQTRSRYTSLAAIDVAIREIYTEFGFSISFDEIPMDKENWIHVRADVANGGFTKHYHRFLPWTEKGIYGKQSSTTTHANMGANTYVRRALLKNIFNLSEEDDDGNRAGGRPNPPAPIEAQRPVQSASAEESNAAQGDEEYSAERSVEEKDEIIQKLRDAAAHGLQFLNSYASSLNGTLEKVFPADRDEIRAVYKELRDAIQAGTKP